MTRALVTVRAVLLDFDGVVANTANVHIAAWERTFGAMGWQIPAEVCARAVEQDDRLFLSGVFAERGIGGGDVPGWVERKRRIALEMIKDASPVYPGIPRLLERLPAPVSLAVVSGSGREIVETSLAGAGLLERFRSIICKEDVTRPKPDPEGYRKALLELGADCESAVAIEDSATGVAAARAADIRCIAVGHNRPRGDWCADAAFVENLEDVDRVVAMILGSD